MPVFDNDIADWSILKASNVPTENQPILRDLAKQFRNIKAVVRAEGEKKYQEQPTELATFAYVSPSAIDLTGGDLRHILQEGRRIYAYGPSFTEAIGRISDFADLGATARAAIVWTQGIWASDATEVRLGTARITPPCVPQAILRGKLDYEHTTVGQTIHVKFRDVNSHLIDLPNTHYHVHIQPSLFFANQSTVIVQSVAKSVGGFDFVVNAADVLPIGGHVTFEWFVLAAPWY